MSESRPRIAIIDSNTLAALGLKQMLQNVMPIMTVDAYGSFSELVANHPERYFHYFVSLDIMLQQRDFFTAHNRKTIVLSPTPTPVAGYHSLCINQPEPLLIRELLMLVQHAHSHGRNLPPIPAILQQKVLTDRETEVMALIVQGYINKEIADRLHIGLSTVVTHRKNIMDKLGFRSVSALTIYAVMHGYVDINTISTPE
jgi:DNA-binding NarL/FixJ family response regulator